MRHGMKHLSRMVAVAATGLALAAGSALAAGPSTERERIAPAVSKPSQVFEMSMPMVGFAWEVPVKEGDAVKEGQLLIKQDTRLQERELESLKVAAESTIGTRLAEAELANAQVNLERVTEMHRRKVASETELREATLAVEIAKLKVEKAKEDQQLADIKYRSQLDMVDMMHLRSKVDGVVAKLDIAPGEVIEREKPAVTVVVNDPLFVETRLPTAMVAKLKKGERLQVGYLNDNRWLEAEITFIQPVADASADRQLVRLTMRNPEGRDAGLQMVVKLPDKLFETSAADQNASADR
jgi:RND family efflux transporter MFP subunit